MWDSLKSSQLMFWFNRGIMPVVQSLYTQHFLSIFKKIHSGMFMIFSPVLGFLSFYYLTYGVNKLRSPGVLGWWYLRPRQHKSLYLFICLFCLDQFPHFIISFLFSYFGNLSCGRETDLKWVKIDTLRVSVAVVKDMLKPNDWIASDLNSNVCDFAETNKKIFLQYEAESSLSMPIEESSKSAVVILAPSRPITNVLMSRKGS